MKYEELKLRPATGALDRDAITAWLAACDYAFLDPIEGRIWHLSATKQEMEDRRHERLANPARMPTGVFVQIFSDHVSVNAYWAGNAEPRALQFVRWLVSRGEWQVQRDQAPFEPVGDPARLFPDGTDEPDFLFSDLSEGVRHTWHVAGSTFLVHSSRQFARQDETGTWRGELSPWAMDEWDTAVSLALPEGLHDFVEPDVATADFTIEDATGIERVDFDAANIPPAFGPLAALVRRWSEVLAAWSSESQDADLRRVRRE